MIHERENINLATHEQEKDELLRKLEDARVLVQTLQEGLKKAEGSISATSAANASLRESVNKQEDSIAELSEQKTMLTTERDALLENKKILKT